MKKSKGWGLKTAAGILAALLVTVSAYAAAQSGRVAQLEESVHAAYERAFYESADLMSRLENTLHKLLVTGSDTLAQEMLGELEQTAAAAEGSLSLLPSSLKTLADSMKFVNQAGDYAAVLSLSLSEGGSITDADRKTLAALRDTATALNKLIAQVTDEIARGENPLSTAEDAAPGSDSAPETDSSIEYPVLLYDGPFSDGRGETVLRALTGGEISEEDALNKARRFIGEERTYALWVTSEGSVPVPCYEISGITDEGAVSLAVTKQGGEVLYMLTDMLPAETLFDPSALMTLSAAFLKENGYPNCAASYYTEYDGVMTISMVPLQEGVLLYPDLIKVELSMESGEIVGFEALNYLSSHTDRTLPSPALSEIQARSHLSAALEAHTGRLCLIPLKNAEILCYEFSAKLENERFLIYIDALTGEERIIYRLIENEFGQLAM